MTPPLEVVFLTNFSDTCFRAIPSIAQMSDDLSMRLTILHAYDPANATGDEETALKSFFPEADSYPGTRRSLTQGDPVDAIKRLTMIQSVDLVICPGCDPLGFPRLGHRSMRGRIAHECGLPVWTIGRKIDPARLGRPMQNVACWMEFGSDETSHLAFAVEFAWKLGAKLHLLHALPDIDEGMMTPDVIERPLHPQGVRQHLYKLMQTSPIQPLIHVHSGNGRRTRAAIAAAHNADILFTTVSRSTVRDWLFSEFNALDRCGCPVVTVSTEAPARLWNLERGPGWARKGEARMLGVPGSATGVPAHLLTR